MKPVYLDNHATTPLDPRVFEAMMPHLRDEFGNASSSTHCYGWSARAAVEKARKSVAQLIGAYSDEIVFCSGATEANNWALQNVLKTNDHCVSTAFEHPSVLESLEFLKTRGVSSTLVSPDTDGQISLAAIREAITPQTRLISVMMANNEIGSVQPIAQLGELAKDKGLLFHCDGVQGAGKVAFSIRDLKVDFLSMSAHKMYGPKGVGALFIARERKAKLGALVHGGGQEGGLRAGTLNVAGVVGFGVACDISASEMSEECARVAALRDRLWKGVLEIAPNTHLNGAMDNRLSGNLNVSFEGVDGESLLIAVQNEIAISTGSACSSSSQHGSHVLRAIGLAPELIQASFRFGIGRFNSENDIDKALEVLRIALPASRC
jgi:cysteine desulfurase